MIVKKDIRNEHKITPEIEHKAFVNEFVTGQSIISPEFRVEKLVCPPMELNTAPSQYHCVAFCLSRSPQHFNRFDGKEYYGAANVGDFDLLPAGVGASWSWQTTNTALLFTISQDFLNRIVSTTDFQNANRLELQSIILDNDPRIKTLADYFRFELESNYLGGSLAMDSLKNLVGIHLLRYCCNTAPILRTYEGGLSGFKLQQTIDYIQGNLDRDLSLTKMSELLGLSEYYFCRMFKVSTGVSPHQYVIRARIERAKSLICRSNRPLSDIAFHVGFASQSHFNRHFKRLVGITPKQFQNQL